MVSNLITGLFLSRGSLGQECPIVFLYPILNCVNGIEEVFNVVDHDLNFTGNGVVD
jgi:hypothetical protein